MSIRRVESLLTHYFRTAFEAAGLRWDSDHASEIGQLADAIEMAARDAAREVLAEHTESTPHLYPDGSSA